MSHPRVPAFCIAFSMVFAPICHAGETWLIGPGQRDRGAVEELLERASATGARVWRDGARFLVAGALGDLARETGVNVETFAGPERAGILPTTDFAPAGSVHGVGEIVTMDHAENAAFLGASFLLDRVEGVAWGSDGTFILDSPYASGSSARALNFARQFGLRVEMMEHASAAYELKRPRLGVAGVEAWVTTLLERYRVPFERAPGSGWRSKYDTVLAGAGESAAASEVFVNEGGTVIRIAPARQSAGFVRVRFEPGEPLAFGMPSEEWVRPGGAFERIAGPGRTIARFENSGAPAIREELSGKGRVIAFAFPPATYASCKLLLNAVYLGSARKL